MTKLPPRPPLDGLRRQIARAREGGSAGGAAEPRQSGAFVRETYRLEREEARQKAREWFSAWPKAAYWTAVESWRPLPDDRIEFTMRRLPSAD